ncbi:MAG: DUF1460 domain-containing protein [Pseudoflavonifractor sp.]|nr:DUF1460 domain-containing protein [Alloprevotella sp.]MCM1116397.1 DUF1460 domain-containing protein [Pseudoflavonifractor sp.]
MSLKPVIIVITLLLSATTVTAQVAGNATFCNEAADTARLTSMLIDAVAAHPAASSQSVVLPMAELFIGTPYKAGTLDQSDDLRVAICLDGMDCTTFVDNVMALAITVGEGRSSWRDFAYNLERLRYRGGKAYGYPSRLHYVSDWVIDNTNRGLITEVTDRIGRADHSIKSLNWMTTHRGDYPALSDSATFAAIKGVESGYHSHKTPYIKTANVMGANLRDGDIVAITTKKPGLDISHLGIIKIVKGKPTLLHASSATGAVTLEKMPLDSYLRRQKDATGIRVFRLTPR